MSRPPAGGCKNFLGHSKSCDHNFILYPGIDSRSSGDRSCQTDDNGVFANQYFKDNTCFESDGLFYTFAHCNRSNVATTVYETTRNAFFADNNATFLTPCDGVADGLAAWKALGQDSQSTIGVAPGVGAIIRMANATLVWD